MKNSLRRLLYISREFGFDPIKLLSALRGLIWFTVNLTRYYSRSHDYSIQIQPVFSDKNAYSGSANGHYFWQDLICAKWIFEQSPETHLDVGSRIDGFIAHLLTFMKVYQIDVRENPLAIDGFTSLVSDLTENFEESNLKFSSVSSLHSLEHFGLGRYGDAINPIGHELGLMNLSTYVSSAGFFYVSYPVGNQIVQFNAQRLLRADWAVRVLAGFEPLQYVNIPWRGTPKFGHGSPKHSEFEAGSAVLIKFKKI